MNLSFFPADKGDCLLVTGADGKHLLVDGGMAATYREFVAPALGRLHAAGKALDLICVSHIDQDHISGILELMNDRVAWGVHDYQVANGNEDHRPPERTRPPEISAIWHNAFNEQIEENAGPIAAMLAATATILFGDLEEGVQAEAWARQNLATSVSEAIRLSRRIGPAQLGIPLNPEFGGGLVSVRENEEAQPIHLGGMDIWILAPFEEDLRVLREEWNEWLSRNRRALDAIEERAGEAEKLLEEDDVQGVLQPLLAQAGTIGQRSRVTAPNLASIMALVEEGSTSLLLTGDGHATDISKGLRHVGKLNGSSGLHVTTLKVQHHGSEYNVTPEFCRQITADNYVFSANGAHDNPDPRAVNAFIDSRLGEEGQRSPNPQASGRFTMWFNSSSTSSKEPKHHEHMRMIEDLVAKRSADSGSQLQFVFRSAQSPEAPELNIPLE